jgi:hypothetical protein
MANVIRLLPSGAAGFTVLPSAARTTAPDTQEFEVTGRGYEYRGLHLIIDATVVTSTQTLTVTVSGVDRVSGKLYTLLASAAITAASTVVLKIGPDLTPVNNLAVNDYLPPVFRVSVALENSLTATYSISGMLV